MKSTVCCALGCLGAGGFNVTQLVGWLVRWPIFSFLISIHLFYFSIGWIRLCNRYYPMMWLPWRVYILHLQLFLVTSRQMRRQLEQCHQKVRSFFRNRTFLRWPETHAILVNWLMVFSVLQLYTRSFTEKKNRHVWNLKLKLWCWSIKLKGVYTFEQLNPRAMMWMNVNNENIKCQNIYDNSNCSGGQKILKFTILINQHSQWFLRVFLSVQVFDRRNGAYNE